MALFFRVGGPFRCRSRRSFFGVLWASFSGPFLGSFFGVQVRPGRAPWALVFLALVWGAWAALVRSWRAPWAVRVAGVAAFFVSMVGAPVRRGCALLRRRVAGACARAARGFCCCGWALARCVVRALGARASLARRAGVALVARSRP